MQVLYLDTPIHYDRIFRSTEEKEQIEKVTRNKKLFSSTFVYNEFKKIGLNSVILFYNLLVDKNTRNPIHALQRSGRYVEREIARGNLSKGVQSKIVDIFATYCQNHRDDKELILKKLQMWIEEKWEVEFEDEIRLPLLNSTNCQRCNGFPVMELETYRPIPDVCNLKNPPECNIIEFWKIFNSQLKKIINFDDKSLVEYEFDKDNFRTIKSSLREIESGKCPVGRRCKVFLSDLIIALESTKIEEDYAILTTNIKDFFPFCKILDIKLKSPND